MIVLPCTNDDESCGPNASHPFPQEGEEVVLTCTEARIVGSTEYVTIRPGSLAIVSSEIIQAAHQVGVVIDPETVWVDVTDDIAPLENRCPLETSYGTGYATTYCTRTRYPDREWCAEHLFEWGRITDAQYDAAPATSKETP